MYIYFHTHTPPNPDLAVKNLGTIKSTNAFYFIKLLNFSKSFTEREKQVF